MKIEIEEGKIKKEFKPFTVQIDIVTGKQIGRAHV